MLKTAYKSVSRNGKSINNPVLTDVLADRSHKSLGARAVWLRKGIAQAAVQAVQRTTRISGVLSDVMYIQSILFLLETSWKHFFTAIVQITLVDLCVEINTEAFCLKLTVICTFLEVDVSDRFNHLTSQHVVFDWFESSTRFSGVNEEKNQGSDER